MAFKHCPSKLCHVAFKCWPLGYATWIEPKQPRLNLKLYTPIPKVPMCKNLQPKFLDLGLGAYN